MSGRITSTNRPAAPAPAPLEAPARAAAVEAGSAAPGMASDGFLSRVGKAAGVEATPLTAQALRSELKFSVLSSIPMEAIFNGQAYRTGKLKANAYLGKTLSNSIGFASWTAGGALVGSFIPGGTLIGGVLGFAGGMIANSIWNRTVGKPIEKALTAAIPEKAAKPVANFLTRFVANPLHDWVWQPAKDFVLNHKVMAGVIAGGLALALPGPAKGLARMAGMMAGGTLLGMGADKFVLDKFLPPAPEEEGEQPARGYPAGSALGEYDAEIPIGAEERKAVRQSFPEVFDQLKGQPAQLQSDMEKILFLKLLAANTSDQARAQQFEATSQALLEQFQAFYFGDGGASAEAPSAKAAPAAKGAATLGTAAASGRGADQGSALGELDAQIQLNAEARAYLRKRYSREFDWAGQHPAQQVSDMEKLCYLRWQAESATDPVQAVQFEAAFDQAAEAVNAAWGGTKLSLRNRPLT